MARQGWAGEKSGLFEHPGRSALIGIVVQADQIPARHRVVHSLLAV